MKISIITVVYNNEKTIEDAISSVLSQNYKNIEYIIIDGNSTDNTPNIISKHLSNINNYISEADKGIYDAMNKGIMQATGEVIGILNSDDLYHDENVISDVMIHFNNDPDLDILYGDLVYVGNEDPEKIVRRWDSVRYHRHFFELGHVPPHPSLFVKSRIYKEAGLFNTKYALAADYEFMLRIFKKFNFKSLYIQRLIVKMRLGGATNKHLKNVIKGNQEILRAWKDNGFKAPFFLMPVRIIRRLMQFIK
ncbi:glycosyltransferase family 2 protein [Mucilaginibacter sp. L3T2-6]|uniref:glycosyltransferase family 2 protein n=1 Tax=Mucilaginibacter sp. L3T2-6 TaxID=3062491 RepID=UPI002674DEE5|nr:glycosyltransferase family 2 protein [Mucilaginibacter sp. L3T2-6]MDO3642468.1 glycosyltransferase family 2 protein [Mucilaginibacter sp. L3T2-6]MDV6215136.1 glycosyltransferase family 2 protein [Mucilaginibacter sp. L3T2-6]